MSFNKKRIGEIKGLENCFNLKVINNSKINLFFDNKIKDFRLKTKFDKKDRRIRGL